jgi:hypothetical protein
MEEFDINSIIKDINFEDEFIGYINNDIVLSNKEMEVLKRNEIDYEKYDTISRLLTDIDDALIDNDDEELEEISQSISERNYYLNTNK